MTTTPEPTLDGILAMLSRDIWERLRDVKALPPANSVRLGEETITDLLMLDLNRQGLTSATFTQTPKHREATRGTDFECWLGSDHTGWLRLAVQAKKLNLRSERYANLKHKSKGGRQIDRLERYAASNEAIPLYCLYNYSEFVVPSKHWHCCQRPFQEEELGCTITPSTNIRKVIGLWGKKNFDYIHRYENTIPWRCLASCPMVRELFMETPIAGPPGQARRPSPFPSHRRLYPELPPRVRVDVRGDSPYRDRRPIPSDELDPDYYNREVGFPSRICVFETQPGELAPSYDQPFFDYGGNSS